VVTPSQWPSGLKRGSAAACLMRMGVLIPTGAWMSVCCECCVLSGRGLCGGLIIRAEEFYCRLWRVVVFDLETTWIRRPWSTGGCPNKNKQTNKQRGGWLVAGNSSRRLELDPWAGSGDLLGKITVSGIRNCVNNVMLLWIRNLQTWPRAAGWKRVA